jgi:NADH:ubiquinone oxidoreductase subunit 4 (subunit M)
VFQSDIKKLVAYSTTSQLGYICLGCGLGNYSAAVFHLFTHTFLAILNLVPIIFGLLINQLFLKFMLHFINLGLILAGGVIVRQLTIDPAVLSINLIT